MTSKGRGGQQALRKLWGVATRLTSPSVITHASDPPPPPSFTQLSSPVSSFFLNDPAPTEIYTLSLHDALPICRINEKLQTVDCPGIGYSHRTDRAARIGA